MRSSHAWALDAPRFDERSLVSCAGLVPVLALAEQTGLEPLLERVQFKASKVRSGGVNPAGKLGCVIAGMVAGADYIEDVELLRSGGMPQLFCGVYAPSTVGILLREFTFGHTLQLASAARAHLVALAERTPVLAGPISGCSSTSTRCCARFTVTPNRARVSGTPRSPGGKCCVVACRRWPLPCPPRARRR